MSENTENKITWDNVHEKINSSCGKEIGKIEEFFNSAQQNIKLGITPSKPPSGEPNYLELKTAVENDLKQVNATTQEIHNKLNEIENIRQPFQHQIDEYDKEMANIIAQVDQIEKFLEKHSEISHPDIQKLRDNRDELKSSLSGLQSQKEVLTKQAQEIDLFPSRLFTKGSPSDEQGQKTLDPRLLMQEAKKRSSDLRESLSDIFSSALTFFSCSNSILARATNFLTSKKPHINQLCTASNDLMKNLESELSQKISNTSQQ